jgi:hypothetical protein
VGDPVTSTTYADLLKNNLLPAVKSKRRGHLSTGVLLQHDNAQSHTASSTVATIQDCPLSVFHIPRTRHTSHPATFMFWTAQRGDGMLVIQVRRRGAAGGARLAALSAKSIF